MFKKKKEKPRQTGGALLFCDLLLVPTSHALCAYESSLKTKNRQGTLGDFRF
jgi:hypothetical protein